MICLYDAGWENEYDFIFTAVTMLFLPLQLWVCFLVFFWVGFFFFFFGGIFTGMPWKDLQTFWPG